MSPNFIFCPYCSTPYENTNWPKQCIKCNDFVYKNPKPVAVGIVPVEKSGQFLGLLGIRRGIQPKLGEIAFPGGYIEHEVWQTALAREILEETNISVNTASITLFDTLSSPNLETILIFGVTEPIDYDVTDWTFISQETQELLIIDSDTDLGFPLHAKIKKNYLEYKFRYK